MPSAVVTTTSATPSASDDLGDLASEKSYEKNDRTDLESLQPTAELCAWYRTRIAGFEAERAELLRRLTLCNPQREELHKTDWELRKRTDEVKDLQKALSDAHAYLFDERQRLLELQAENDALKLQEMEDRKRIQHLLALTEPVEQEITYARQGRPDTFHLLPKQPPMGGHNATVSGGARTPAHMAQPTQACERVMRTVYLPTSNVESLLLKCESLQAQLNEQKRYSNERIAALLEDRRLRESDEASYRAAMQRKLEEAYDKLKHSDHLLANTTKDYIVMRRAAQENEQVKMEAEEETKRTQMDCVEDRLAQQMRHEEQMDGLKRELGAAQEKAVGQFRSQLKRKEEELVGLGGVHAAVMAQYQSRIGELEAWKAHMTAKYKRLEDRRAMDLEGFNRDVTALRKALGLTERKLHQMRLVLRLDDDDRLDKLLEMLEKKAPGPEKKKKSAEGVKLGAKPRPASARFADMRTQQATLSQNLDSLKVHVDALDDKVKAVPPQKNPTPA